MTCYNLNMRHDRIIQTDKKRGTLMEKNYTPRWSRVTAGIILMVVLGSMYAWSYFKVTLGQAFPTWTEKQITMNFTLMMCLFCIGGVVAGRLSKKLSQSVELIIAAVMMCVGFLGVSFLPQGNSSTALILTYVCYAGLNGLGTGIAYNSVLSAVQPWFLDRSGLISGVLLMSLGFGTLILGNVAAALISAIGLFPTFRVFAVMDLVVLLVGSPFIRLPRENEVIHEAPAPAAGLETKDYTTGEMVKRPTFWFYFCWNICLAASGMLVVNSASSISVFYGAAATLGLLVSVFNGCGRFITGLLLDKLPWKAVMFLVNGVILVSGALMLVGDVSSFNTLVFIGMMIMGLCYGSGITMTSTLIRRLYGNQNYASNFSVANLCTFPAAVIGPMIAAALQDASTGYTTTFLMVIIIGVIALALNFPIRKP